MAPAKKTAKKTASKSKKVGPPVHEEPIDAAIVARAKEIHRRLARAQPAPQVELDHDDAWQLLIATILAARSNDRTINTITPTLFERWPTPADLAAAPQGEVEGVVKKSGFFRNKAKAIRNTAQAVVTDFGGEVPATMEGLTSLPGVARKTANVVLGTALGINAGVVVDTHVKRLAGRLGLSGHTDPSKIERDLMAAIPQASWTDAAHQLIWHGRRVCHARKPACDECTLAPVCPQVAGPA